MSFDTLAPIYRWMEYVFAGGKMQRCRLAFLHQIEEPKSILIFGEGPGRFLVECCRGFPHAQVTCLDLSSKMLAQAAAHLALHRLESKHVSFIHADVLIWEPPAAEYDLIVSHFFLDCFRADQLALIIPKLAHAAKPGCNWLFADFQVAQSGLKHWRSRFILALLYRFFSAVTRLSANSLASPDPFLKKAGFTLHRRIESDWDLLKSDWWRRQ